jgi:hypothetical protein
MAELAMEATKAAIEIFDNVPSEARLARLLDPERRSTGAKIVETGAEYRVEPRGVSMWLICCSMAMPMAAIVWLVQDRYTRNGAIEPGLWIGVIMAPLAVLAVIGIMLAINSSMEAPGTFAILDRASGTLHLPRQNLSVRPDQIAAFVVVDAWFRKVEQEGWSRDTIMSWVSEASVLVREADGRLARIPVMCCENPRKVRRVGEYLAQWAGVPLHRVVVDRHFRGQHKMEVQTARTVK